MTLKITSGRPAEKNACSHAKLKGGKLSHVNKLQVPCARFQSCIFFTKPQAQQHHCFLISSERPAKTFCLESIIPSLFLLLILPILMREISITIIIHKLVMRGLHVTIQCSWQPGHTRCPQAALPRQKCHPRG